MEGLGFYGKHWAGEALAATEGMRRSGCSVGRLRSKASTSPPQTCVLPAERAWPGPWRLMAHILAAQSSQLLKETTGHSSQA